MTVAIAGEYVTVRDAAKELGLSDVRVRQFFRGGRLVGQIIGQQIFIEKQSFLDFKRQNRRPGRQKKTA